jgi:hypothetical protein
MDYNLIQNKDVYESPSSSSKMIQTASWALLLEAMSFTHLTVIVLN